MVDPKHSSQVLGREEAIGKELIRIHVLNGFSYKYESPYIPNDGCPSQGIFKTALFILIQMLLIDNRASPSLVGSGLCRGHSLSCG